MKRKLGFGVLGLLIVVLCAGGTWADDASDLYPIMKPDRETRLKWIHDYETAPRAYIDRSPNFKLAPEGSLSLLSHLPYTPSERNQGSCGNCWAWAGTGVLEIALDVQENIFDRLSVQFISSCNTPQHCCDGGWLSDLAGFYASKTYAIPWSNTNAYWQNGNGSCNVPCANISTSPSYGITSIETQTIPTYGVGQATAIANIKNVLNQNKAVWFAFFMGTAEDWDNFFSFWRNQPESAIWDFDPTCNKPWSWSDGGGHAVLCVGYNDDDPANAYWIMLNSWGTTAGRPNGIFRVAMDMNYDCADTIGFKNLYWQTLGVTFDGEHALDIRANGADGPIVISQGDAASITVSLDPGQYAGSNADWWIAVHTPFAPPGDWYSYVHPTGWMPGVHRCAQNPLFQFSGFEVLDRVLPVGNYTFYFAVDPPDGIPTAELLDSVAVEVTP